MMQRKRCADFTGKSTILSAHYPTGMRLIGSWIDMKETDRIREELPFLKQRRTDIYTLE